MRTKLTNLYYQLSEGQKALFNRMYGSIETIEDSKIDIALSDDFERIKNLYIETQGEEY